MLLPLLGANRFFNIVVDRAFYQVHLLSIHSLFACVIMLAIKKTPAGAREKDDKPCGAAAGNRQLDRLIIVGSDKRLLALHGLIIVFVGTGQRLCAFTKTWVFLRISGAHAHCVILHGLL